MTWLRAHNFLVMALVFFSPGLLLGQNDIDGELEKSATTDMDAQGNSSEEYESFGEWEDSPWTLGGFVRQMIHGTESALPRSGTALEHPITSATRLRLSSEYDDGIWKGEASANLDLIFANNMSSTEFDLTWMGRTRNRLFSLEKRKRYTDYLVQADVHRLWAGYTADDFQIKAGRQAISWGQGRFLNPLDLVTPLSPFLIDSEDVPGADAIDISYYFNAFDMIELVVAPYKTLDDPDLGNLRSRDLNGLLRFKGTRENVDFTLLAGHHFHSWVWGGELAADIKGASIRFAYLGRAEEDWSKYEGYGTNPPPSVTHQVVLGTGYAFFSGKLSANLEIFYNSGSYGDGRDSGLPVALEQEAIIEAELAPLSREDLLTTIQSNYYSSGTLSLPTSGISQNESDDDIYFYRTAGRITSKNPLLIEASLGGNLTDTINLNFFFIGDPVGESLYAGPSVSVSLTEESVLTGGAFLFVGPDDRTRAEFQGAKPSAYLLLRWHF